jgi:hypothetical protein
MNLDNIEKVNDITKQRVWSTAQLVRIVLAAVFATFTMTLIYTRFLFIENEIGVVSERANKREIRNTSNFNAVWGEINTLKEKNKTKENIK